MITLYGIRDTDNRPVLQAVLTADETLAYVQERFEGRKGRKEAAQDIKNYRTALYLQAELRGLVIPQSSPFGDAFESHTRKQTQGVGNPAPSFSEAV